MQKLILIFSLLCMLHFATACSTGAVTEEAPSQDTVQQESGQDEEPIEETQQPAPIEEEPQADEEEPSPTEEAIPVEESETESMPPIPVVIETGEVIHLVNGPLSLRIISPGDGAVVSVPEVEILGEVSLGTVLTVGDEILVIEDAPEFSLTVPLEEGMNLIELVASDYAGNELSYYLAVIYEMDT